MSTISSVALGLNGGCCFAYAVLFGVMQERLLSLYGVEARTDRFLNYNRALICSSLDGGRSATRRRRAHPR